jgi:C-terminal processing protease CtpA/Prc
MTFSAAEEFAYNLKNLKRAIIIGNEKTGGGANPGDEYRLTDHFSAFIPNGRAINPITNTNWEGTGVLPDIEVKHTEVFRKAYGLALQSNIDRSKSDKDKSSWLKNVLGDLTQGKLPGIGE